jgi:Ser/Thr protein kinase RdoA (MazF antagonist)
MKFVPIEKDDFIAILKNYAIGVYVSSKRNKVALENAVYILETTKGKFVLKRFDHTKEDYIKYQNKIESFLIKKKIPLPKVIKSKKGSLLIHYKKKPVQIQAFVTNKKPKLTNALVKEIGKIVGKMDVCLLEFPLNGKFIWEKEYQFKKRKLRKNMFSSADLVKIQSQIVDRIRTLDKTKLKKSVIHGDANMINMLFDKNRLVGIIDFGDVHEDYRLTDPMFFISDKLMHASGIDYSKVKIFLKAYTKYVALNDEELRAILYFAQLRCLFSIDWINWMIKKHPDQKKKLRKYFNIRYNENKMLSKITAEEFLLKIKS